MMNIMNPPADWSTLKKLIWLRGTPINGGEELTVSGTPPLSLPNSLGKPLKAWSVDLSPYQEGTGDPSPDNVRPIHGTDKLNLFVEESYDQSATPKAVLTLPQTVYTGTIGSEGGESRDYAVDLGSLNWRYFPTFPYFEATLPVQAKTSSQGYDLKNEICEMFPTKTWRQLYAGTSYGICSGNSGTVVDVSCEDYTDPALFKTAMSGVLFVYEMANPTALQIAAPTIPTPTGTATTWATAEDGTVDSMSVTYIGKASS